MFTIIEDMNIEEFREYCLAKPITTEDLPFDENTLVFKVDGKMFALTSLKNFISINLKCDPDRALELREEFEQINPGYHMSKVHWNTITIEGIKREFLLELIDHSYNLVVSKFSKKRRMELGI